MVCTFLLLTAFTIAFLLGPDGGTRLTHLQQRNTLLTGWVDTLRSRYESLSGELAELAEDERAYRQLAGLAPLGEIGGGYQRVDAPGPAGGEKRDLPWLARPEPMTGVGRATVWPAQVLTFTSSRSPWLAAGLDSGIDSGDRAAASPDLDLLMDRANRLAGHWNRATALMEPTETARIDLDAIPSIMPARGYLTDAFTAKTHPLFKGTVPHEGIDIAAPPGSPVRASASGRVAHAGRVPGYGLLVVLDHGNGFITKYAHLSQTDVARGQRVQRGDRIGTVGETGITAGPHLHYEVILNGWPRDPLDYVLDRAGLTAVGHKLPR